MSPSQRNIFPKFSKNKLLIKGKINLQITSEDMGKFDPIFTKREFLYCHFRLTHGETPYDTSNSLTHPSQFFQPRFCYFLGPISKQLRFCFCSSSILPSLCGRCSDWQLWWGFYRPENVSAPLFSIAFITESICSSPRPFPVVWNISEIQCGKEMPSCAAASCCAVHSFSSGITLQHSFLQENGKVLMPWGPDLAFYFLNHK